MTNSPYLCMAVGIVPDHALPIFTLTHPSSTTTTQHHRQEGTTPAALTAPDYQQQAPYAVHYPAKCNPPSYHYPSPNAPVFTPLPKQLSTLVPITPQEPPTKSEIPPPPPPQTSPPTSSSYIHIGSIFTAHESTHPQPRYRKMGHLVLQTPRSHPRTQHHHLPKSLSTP